MTSNGDDIKKEEFGIPWHRGEIPRLTTEQMIEVDRLMIEKYQIQLIQMMENAGRNLALLARKRFLDKSSAEHGIMVLAGTGGNGGGAMVCARRLSGWGYSVKVVVTHPEKLKEVPGHQFKILQEMGVEILPVDSLAHERQPDLIVDGIIGYSLSGDPVSQAAELIQWANEMSCPILALDTPSGIDLSTGAIYSPVIVADATLTLALPKVGLYREEVKRVRGELYLGDISVPALLYSEPSLGLKVENLFQNDDLIRLD